MKKLIWILSFASLVLQGFPQSTEVPFTLEDRDRLIKLEEKLNATNEKIESLQNETNGKIESLRNDINGKTESLQNETNGKIESLRNEMNAKFEAVDSKIETMYWGLGVIITLILFMLGYMIWDRRTALHPVQKKTMEHEEKFRKLEHIAKEHAKKDPSFAELLRVAGLL